MSCARLFLATCVALTCSGASFTDDMHVGDFLSRCSSLKPVLTGEKGADLDDQTNLSWCTSHLFPLLLKRVYDDKDVQEQIVKSSGLDWTIVRPGLLKDSPATGRYRVLTASKDWRAGAISRADVADFLVRQINDRALIGSTPLLIS
jgi:hypothetical protein